MKNKTGSLIAVLALLVSGLACNMSTANLSSLKLGKDKDATQETTAYKAGDTIYGVATVSNNPGKVTVTMYLTVDEAPGMNKGETVPNSEVKLELNGDGTARYNFPTFPTTRGGKFNMVADMINEAGEKKDSKTASFTVAPGSSAGS